MSLKRALKYKCFFTCITFMNSIISWAWFTKMVNKFIVTRKWFPTFTFYQILAWSWVSFRMSYQITIWFKRFIAFCTFKWLFVAMIRFHMYFKSGFIRELFKANFTWVFHWWRATFFQMSSERPFGYVWFTTFVTYMNSVGICWRLTKMLLKVLLRFKNYATSTFIRWIDSMNFKFVKL